MSKLNKYLFWNICLFNVYIIKQISFMTMSVHNFFCQIFHSSWLKKNYENKYLSPNRTNSFDLEINDRCPVRKMRDTGLMPRVTVDDSYFTIISENVPTLCLFTSTVRRRSKSVGYVFIFCQKFVYNSWYVLHRKNVTLFFAW